MGRFVSDVFSIGLLQAFGKVGIVVVAYKHHTGNAVVQKEPEAVDTGVVLHKVHVHVEAGIYQPGKHTGVYAGVGNEEYLLGIRADLVFALVAHMGGLLVGWAEDMLQHGNFDALQIAGIVGLYSGLFIDYIGVKGIDKLPVRLVIYGSAALGKVGVHYHGRGIFLFLANDGGGLDGAGKVGDQYFVELNGPQPPGKIFGLLDAPGRKPGVGI